jgi:uncharacterized cupredoxin-like copper-binding protein
MTDERPSVARSLTVAGLILQFALTVILIHRTTDLASWLRGLSTAQGDALGGAAALLLLLALIVPAWRGRTWALVLAVLLQVGLLLGIVPYLAASFAHPADFTAWLLNVSYFEVGVLAVAFGLITTREGLGRARARSWRSLQGAAVWAAGAVWIGMVAVGAAVASAPTSAGTFDTPAAHVVTLRMGAMSFSPPDLHLPAGQPTALVVVNESTESHSFDVDPLAIHLRVPGKSTALVVVTLPAGPPIPFYCGIPGHREAGMTGTLIPE